MDMPVNVPVDDPNADTEWNDILRKHKIIPEKPPSPTPQIEAALTEARRLAHENRLEGKDLAELDELEDLEDDDFLDRYRQQRMGELAALQHAAVYNQVYHLQKPDYAREVTDESAKSWVFVLLVAGGAGNSESRVGEEVWRVLAGKFGEVKFCQMRADLCIEGYPERNCPTVLVYREGEIRWQIVTLKELKGTGTSGEDFERVLLELRVVQRNDSRLKKRDEESGDRPMRSIRQSARPQRADGEEDDSDWD